ncbi:MAG: hypothetical protein ACJ780_03050, partial [Solirubrobacteraceae bacterium]
MRPGQTRWLRSEPADVSTTGVRLTVSAFDLTGLEALLAANVKLSGDGDGDGDGGGRGGGGGSRTRAAAARAQPCRTCAHQLDR